MRFVEKPKNAIFRYIILIVGLLFIFLMYMRIYSISKSANDEQPDEQGYQIELLDKTE